MGDHLDPRVSTILPNTLQVEAPHAAQSQRIGVGTNRPNPREAPAKIIKWFDSLQPDINQRNKVRVTSHRPSATSN